MSGSFEVMPSIGDFDEAFAHWQRWAIVMEHRGAPEKNPLLVSAEIFGQFSLEHGFGRTIRAGSRDEFRFKIGFDGFPLGAMLEDESGQELDRLDERLRPVFGTYGTVRGSVRGPLSKIASVLAPQTFYAWERNAEIGIDIVRSRKGAPVSYSTFQTAVADRFKALRPDIIALAEGRYPSELARTGDRFHKRIMYSFLCRIGRASDRYNYRRVATVARV
jgi:hypothetical protein